MLEYQQYRSFPSHKKCNAYHADDYFNTYAIYTALVITVATYIVSHNVSHILKVVTFYDPSSSKPSPVHLSLPRF